MTVAETKIYAEHTRYLSDLLAKATEALEQQRQIIEAKDAEIERLKAEQPEPSNGVAEPA